MKPSKCIQLQQAHNKTWICPLCISTPTISWAELPFCGTESLCDSSFENEPETDQYILLENTSNEPDILEQRKIQHQDLLIVHLNINSIQNKFDELKLLNTELKSQVIILSETKIDSSYKSDQFKLAGYQIYRKDRKKGAGGLMVLISSAIASKKLHPPTLKHIEVTIQYNTIDIQVLPSGLFRTCLPIYTVEVR